MNFEGWLGLGFIVLWIAAIIGWILNAIKLIGLIMASGPITTMFVARCVGVFAAPFGAILGWF